MAPKITRILQRRKVIPKATTSSFVKKRPATIALTTTPASSSTSRLPYGSKTEADIPGGGLTPTMRHRLARRASRRKQVSRPHWASGQTLLEAASVGRMSEQYQSLLANFRTFADSRRLPTEQLPDLDAAVVEYCNHAYAEGFQSDHGTKLVSALAAVPQAAPQLRKLLPRAARAIVGWRKLSPPESRPPMPLEVACHLCLILLRHGEPLAGIAIMIGFSLYLRPLEIMSMFPEDIQMPTASIPCWSVIVRPFDRLVPTKVGQYDDSVMSDGPIGEKILTPMLRRLKSILPCGHHIFPQEQSWLGGALNLAANSSQPAHLKPHPYMLRHGGPSHDRALGLRTIQEVKKRGRWAADSSVRRYEKAGRLTTMLTKIQPELKDQVYGSPKLLENLVNSAEFEKITKPGHLCTSSPAKVAQVRRH